MNYKTVSDGLSDYNKVNVEIYINYLKFMEKDKKKDNTLKNPWFQYFKDEDAIDIYKKVAKDNVFIDGETITLSNRGKIIVSYNYQAYKNVLLNVYPESTFDMQVVYQGDDFSFFKESGRVVYTHRLKDPFATKKVIIGTYCIIKNSRGEFLETLDLEEIMKMRNVATTKDIWDEWFSEMVLKSVIKRACKRHFRDIVVNVEKLDNENYDLNLVNVDSIVQSSIEKATTFAELNKIYKDNVNSVSDKVNFMVILGEKKSKLMELLPNFKTENEDDAIDLLKKYNGKVDNLLLRWKFTEDQKESLITKFVQSGQSV
jgi:hypothetical protein